MNKKLGPGDDLEMINSPDLWPCWPLLPLKNPKMDDPNMPGTSAPGVIIYTNPTRVILGCMFLMNFTDDTPSIQYESVQAMLDAGWIVD